jgi:tetratricopeptide (TPR) repeat protein
MSAGVPIGFSVGGLLAGWLVGIFGWPSIFVTGGVLPLAVAPALVLCSLQRSEDAEIKRMCGLELQRAYTGLKRDSEAVELAMELNRLYPDDGEILYQTAKIYGNFAFLTMEKLAQVAPTSVWRHLAAAEAQESQGSYDEAIAEYREVLRLEPSRPGIHYRIGRTLRGRFWQRHSADDPPAAAKEFEQELQIDPGNANSA